MHEHNAGRRAICTVWPPQGVLPSSAYIRVIAIVGCIAGPCRVIARDVAAAYVDCRRLVEAAFRVAQELRLACQIRRGHLGARVRILDSAASGGAAKCKQTRINDKLQKPVIFNFLASRTRRGAIRGTLTGEAG